MRVKKDAPALNVLMNGRLVGKLERSLSGKTTFTYMKIWLDREYAMPISLSLPLQVAPHQGAVVSNYFNNLLPDLESSLKKIAESVGATGTNAYSLLSGIGRDSAGALQFIASDIEDATDQPDEYLPQTDQEIYDKLAHLSSTPMGIDTDLGFRISIAGAQEKTGLAWHNGQWCLPTGLNPTTHIFKPSLGVVPFAGAQLDFTQSVENEFYCLNLFRAFGIRTANVEMETFIDRKVLIVERFDRLQQESGKILRLPQEDMCQALGYPPTLKYQNEGGPALVDILNVLKSSDRPEFDQRTILMSQILFWLIGAIDGHAKNFSIFLRPNGQMELTPIYDVLSAQPAFDTKKIQHKDYRLAMSVGRKPHYKVLDIHGRYFVETAVAAGLSERFACECITEVQGRFDEAFGHVVEALPDDFPMQIHKSIKIAATDRLSKLKTAFE